MKITTLVSPFGARSTAREVVAGISLIGKNAIVTGGASGLGFETSKALASAGASVTLAVRNLAQGETAAADIRGAYPKASVHAAQLDLADLHSVRSFAADWLAEGKPLDILINNAAIMANPLTRNAQGWESQFATNHLGHFELTTKLLPALLQAAQSTGDARVVSVSSCGHLVGEPDLADLHFEHRSYHKWQAYGQAKSANAMFVLGLHLKYAENGITALSLHPGGIMTGLQKFLSQEEQRAMGWFKADGTLQDIFKTTAQGAATSVWAATAPSLIAHGGRYLEDCQLSVPHLPTTPFAGYAEYITDPVKALKLWDVSQSLLAQVK